MGVKPDGLHVVLCQGDSNFCEAVKDVLTERAGEDMDYVVIARAATVARSYALLLEDLRGALHRVHRSPRHRSTERHPANAAASEPDFQGGER